MVPAMRWVELRYALHRMNKDRENQQVGNSEHREASDTWKAIGKHINGGVNRICKDLVDQIDKRG